VNALLVAAGGAVGALARHAMGQLLARFPGTPWSTMVVNVVGCALLGILAGAVPDGRHPLRLALGVGVLGGFTTFSTFSLDTWELCRRGAWGLAAWQAGGSVVLGGLGVALGLVVGQRLVSG
jgi:CrcB protein